MKKTVFWILISVLLLGAFTPGILWWSFGLASRWEYAADFESCESEFNIIKDYVMAEYYDGKTERYFAVSKDSYGNIRLYDSLGKDYIYWPEEVGAAMEVANRNGFPQEECSLDVIWVKADRITFSSEGRPYELVYMIKGRPDDQHGTWFVKRIGNGWYHMTVNPDA